MTFVETERMIGKCTVETDTENRVLFHQASAAIDLLSLKPSVVYGFTFYDKEASENMVFHLGLDNKRGRTEVSYGTEEQYRHRGYATEGIKAALQWLFANTSEPRFYGLVCNDNKYSIQALLRCGFSYESSTDCGADWYCISREDIQKS